MKKIDIDINILRGLAQCASGSGSKSYEQAKNQLLRNPLNLERSKVILDGMRKRQWDLVIKRLQVQTEVDAAGSQEAAIEIILRRYQHLREQYKL